MRVRFGLRSVAILWLSALLVSGSFITSLAGTEVTGVVSEAGFSSIIMPQKGTEAKIRYHIGRETKYTPKGYRATVGDTVTLNYYNKKSRRGENILAVSSMALKKKDPNRKELVSPAEGVIEEVGRSKIRITYSDYNKTVSFSKKRGCKFTPPGYVPTVGDKVEVYLEDVSNRFTGKRTKVISAIKKL